MFCISPRHYNQILFVGKLMFSPYTSKSVGDSINAVIIITIRQKETHERQKLLF